MPAVRVGRSDVGATTKMDSLAGPGRLEDSLRHIFCGFVALVSKGGRGCLFARLEEQEAAARVGRWQCGFTASVRPVSPGEEGTALAKDFNV